MGEFKGDNHLPTVDDSAKKTELPTVDSLNSMSIEELKELRNTLSEMYVWKAKGENSDENSEEDPDMKKVDELVKTIDKKLKADEAK